MDRSGYTDDHCGDEWELIMYRGAVRSAIRGKRGQSFLRELVAALDSLPEKKLIAGELEESGQVCALGSVGKVRGLPVADLDPYDYDAVSATFAIAPSLAREIMWVNDEWASTPETRWATVRKWATENLATLPTAPEAGGE